MQTDLREQQLPISSRTTIQRKWASDSPLGWVLRQGVAIDSNFNDSGWGV